MIRKSIAKIIFLPVISFFVVFLTLILVFRFAVPRIIARRDAAEYYVEASDEQSFVENTTYENSDSSSGEGNSNISEEDDYQKLIEEGLKEASSEENSSDNISKGNSTDNEKSSDEEEWMLVLVNRTHPVPAGFSKEFTDLSNGQRVDSRIYPDLQDMFDAARADGLELFVREGYRTSEDQQAIMDERINQYQEEGYSYEESKEYAEQYVALPGTSEHELGISVDINADNEVNSDEVVYDWLYENSYKYGFIKRYPEDKIEITGINNEPWHYRYVGKKAAQEMHDTGLCLEEYLSSN